MSLGLSRRDLLRMGLCAGAGLVAGERRLSAQQASARVGMNPGMKMGPASHAGAIPEFHEAEPAGVLASYVTPLSIPPVLRPNAGGQAVPARLVPFEHKVHRDLPAATMWGYNAMWPGPTFEVRRGEPLFVKWLNQLPTRHFLPWTPQSTARRRACRKSAP